MPRHYLPKINKYVTFAASLPVMLSGGLPYTFGIWNEQIKTVYDLSQAELQTIGAAHNIGGYLSFISGLVYDALEHRHHLGPRVSILLGGITNTVGFVGLWLAITQRFTFSIWQIALLALIAGNGGSWFDTCCLTTNIRNFPSSRGTIVGIMKASVGLSASLYSISYTCGFEPHADQFLLFVAVMPAVIVLFIGIPLMNFVPYVQESELDKGQSAFTKDGRFLLSYQIIGTLAIYLMSVALVTVSHDISADTKVLLGIGAVLLLIPIVFIPYGSGGLFAKKLEIEGVLQRYSSQDDFGEYDITQPLLKQSPFSMRRKSMHVRRGDTSEETRGGPEGDSSREAQSYLRGGRDRYQAEYEDTVNSDDDDDDDEEDEEELVLATPSKSLADCFSDSNFYLLAVICGVIIGNGLAFLNNIAQIVAALGVQADTTPVLVSLFGICSCLGRLIFGAVPESALHYGIPRPVFLVLNGIFVSSTFSGLYFCNSSTALQILTCCCGLCFGAQWSLLPSLTSDIFGLLSFASIYTVLQLFPALFSYLLGAVLVGELYQQALKKHGDPGTTCIGRDCFQDSFLCMAVLGGVATVCSLILTLKTLKLYKFEVGALKFFDKEVAMEDPVVLRQYSMAGRSRRGFVPGEQGPSRLSP